MNKTHTTIEIYIIEAVKKRRLELNVSPSKLSLEIGVARSVIGKIENQKPRCKYNFNLLNEVAKVLNCKIADFFSEPYLEEDCIEEYHEIREQRRQELEKSKKAKEMN